MFETETPVSPDIDIYRGGQKLTSTDTVLYCRGQGLLYCDLITKEELKRPGMGWWLEFCMGK